MDEEFEPIRTTLFAIAYNMLGSVMEAEDIVQDAYIRFQAVDRKKVRDVRAFLKTMVTRLCLDTLKSAQVQREQYFGTWLPEPILTDSPDELHTPEQTISREEMVSIAFLTVMEQLTPLERAVFLLRDVFNYGYDEIAEFVERKPDTCRKLYSRAKQHIQQKHPLEQRLPEEQPAILTSFLTAIQSGDMTALLRFLADDVTLSSDGGGKVAAAVQTLYGRTVVTKFLEGLIKRGRHWGDFRTYSVMVNSSPGLIVINTKTNSVDTVFSFDISEQGIRTIHAIRNPDKLRHLQPKDNTL